MLNILTFKIPTPLLEKLDKTSKQRGQSKGAILREAIGKYLYDLEDDLENIRKITSNHFNNVKNPVEMDWNTLRKKCKTSNKPTPEEEVLVSRQRNL